MEWLWGDVTASEAIMNVMMAVACLSVIVSMWKLHRANSRYENFNVVSLITNKDGFLDGAKCMEMGAFLLMSWGFVALVTSGKLTDAYTAAFAGTFAVRGAFGAFLRSKGDLVMPEEGMTKVTKVDVKTVEVLKEPKP